MKYEPDMFESAGCRIMRCELQLLDLPGKLSEMVGRDHDGHQQHLFTKEDDVAVAQIESTRVKDNTFLPYFEDFCSLRNRYTFAVPNYGRFAVVNCGYALLQEVERHNAELQELRRKVSTLLMKRYVSSWKSEYIRRFNPRIKCGLFLLPKAFTGDKNFQAQLTRVFKKEIRKGEMDIQWLLAPVEVKPSKQITVPLDPKSDLHCAYILDHTDF